MNKPFQESHKVVGSKFPLDNHESKDATRGDGRYHVVTKASSSGINDWCFATVVLWLWIGVTMTLTSLTSGITPVSFL